MFRDRIFSLFDRRDGVLVFPTENSARYYLGEYVRDRRCTVPASAAIAFDSFASIFAPKHKDLKPATKFHRIAFASLFMKEQADRLRYFYNPAFSESRSRFIPFIVSILPDIRIRNRMNITRHEILADIDLIYTSYEDFLIRHKLFEPGFEDHHIPEVLPSARYYLIGYDVEIPMQMLLSELGECSFIEKVTHTAEITEDISAYDNENAELLSLFDRVYELMRDGEAAEDIILSSPDVERLRPYIARIAEERGIPVSFVSELSLDKTLPGVFLTLLDNIYSEEFSFEALERLLLASAFPYTDEVRDLNRRLVSFMIDNNVIRGSRSFGPEDKLYTALKRDESLKAHYSAIKSAIVNLYMAEDGKASSKALHGLTTYLFSSDEFISSDEYDDRAVFSFILSQMNSFSETVASLGLKIGSFFSLFLSELPHIPYVRQASKDGIRIYSYGQDYMLDVKHHFVFALSDKNTKKAGRENRFLEEYEVRDLKSYDVTTPLLVYYQSLSEHIYLSSSRETYAGAASPPAAFAAGHVQPARYKGNDYTTFFRSSGFKAASERAFRKNGAESDIGEGMSYPYKSDLIISYSTLDSYTKCPFMTAVGALSDMHENRDVFKPAFMDHKKIGSFLHKVVQTFLSRHRGEMLVDASKDEYKKELKDEFIHQLELFHFDRYTSLYLTAVFMPSMDSFVDKTLEKLPSFVFRDDETLLSVRYEGCTLKGFTDTIAESQGDIVIIDYKKGDAKANAESYQLLLYRKMLELEKGTAADKLLYFSFKSGAYIESRDDEEIEAKLEDDIRLTVDGFREGSWKYTDKRDNCSGCDMRSICRRRFFIQ